MRLAEPAVRPVMGCCGNEADRGGRADHLAAPGERAGHLDTHFEGDLAVPVDRDMPARPRHLLGAEGRPHDAAGVGNDPG